jgi:hypothetical protein
MVGHRQGRYRISTLVRKLLLLSTHWRRAHGFRACAKWRIPDVQLHIGNDELLCFYRSQKFLGFFARWEQETEETRLAQIQR